MGATEERRFRLFVYGTFLPGEPDHGLLDGAELVGPATTQPKYKLVELTGAAALLDRGDTAIVGELYDLDVKTLAACDVKREHPVLFQRRGVELSDGSVAHAYFLSHEQSRGRRRVRGGDWRKRFAPVRSDELSEAGPFVSWARSRHRR
ncbi:MAG: gamma-glutamylcyclotransferase [Deltaproteobacteria bacterium]|nr:gamma-glutamylcyclotransferase [Deltaproteobacteria bacterium]